MKPSKQNSLLNIIKFEDYDDVDLMMYAIQTSITAADRALLVRYSETPNNNISELARSLKCSNYIVKKEIARIKETIVIKIQTLKTI